MKLQLRVKGIRSMMDIDLAGIEQRLAALPVVATVTSYDDRASDATFVTFVVETDGARSSVMAGVRQVFAGLPLVVAQAVFADGQLVALDAIGPAEWPQLDMDRWQ